MAPLLFALRFLVIAGLYYALRKGRKDWSRLLLIASVLLASFGYSLDKNWLWAALQLFVLLVLLIGWWVRNKSA